MNKIDPITLELMFVSVVAILLLFWLFIKGIDKTVEWLNKRNEKREKTQIEFKKYFTVNNYLIALATIATAGIIIIAIKLL